MPKINPKTIIFSIVISAAAILLSFTNSTDRVPIPETTPGPGRAFSGEQAYQDVEKQVSFGPRIPGSEGHAVIVDWIQDELRSVGWSVEVQNTSEGGKPVLNIIGKRLPEEAPGDVPWIILGAHYDTRIFADQDPDPQKRSEAVPGANDGASGVAVLLELARSLPTELDQEIWLVFFDAEDNGRIEGWDWILGSKSFVAELEGEPDAAIIVDMVGDADLNLFFERNSDMGLSAEIWSTAAKLGYTQFIAEPKHSMLDDHTPFLEAGIRAIDIIDFDYPYWHTTQDTPDKVSAASLGAVGRTLQEWLLNTP